MHKLLFVALLIGLLSGCKQNEKLFSGYVDTDLVYLSADFAGRLIDIAVQRGQLINAQQFLFRLEQNSELYNLEMSQLSSDSLLAQRKQILDQIEYNEINHRRIKGMRQKDAASQNDLDMAQRDLDVSRQQLADIDFKIRSSQIDSKDKQWIKSRKENFSLESGIIFDTYYTRGEFVPAGNPILALITKDRIKTVFFVPESKLNLLKINQKIKIHTSQNQDYATGHIYYISNIAEYTPPIIYSREERQRLVFRVEAKIDAPDLEKIHLGQPVTLELS